MKNIPNPYFEIISSPAFEEDLDTQERIIEDKMIRVYVIVVLITSVLLSLVVVL
jgi:hypothetical protein